VCAVNDSFRDSLPGEPGTANLSAAPLERSDRLTSVDPTPLVITSRYRPIGVDDHTEQLELRDGGSHVRRVETRAPDDLVDRRRRVGDHRGECAPSRSSSGGADAGRLPAHAQHAENVLRRK